MHPVSFQGSPNFARVQDRLGFGNQEVESLVISRSWQGPRPQLKSHSSCGNRAGVSCLPSTFLPAPIGGAEVQRGQHYLCQSCVVAKQSPQETGWGGL